MGGQRLYVEAELYHAQLTKIQKKCNLGKSLKSIFFEILSNKVVQKDPVEWRIFFKKRLILVFEVIVQPLVHTLSIALFSPFLAHCGHV